MNLSNCLKCEEYRLRFDRKAELQTTANWMLSLQLRTVLCGLRLASECWFLGESGEDQDVREQRIEMTAFDSDLTRYLVLPAPRENTNVYIN